MQIATQAEYDAAIDRIQALTGAPEGSPEEKELLKLVLAVEIWETKHRIG
ncbi:Transcriptional regulator OS=Bosea thiooxidans OX=53254 GN=SAMN05660750_03304 PE=4 SV=1 [Bosea thiooxidans]|uniref:Uncharacterized protein n=1 Tax=Bosea thiooxidans TaxID=53254 RepID=A0A1T5FKT0_9HYPH|nr:hypothetical protein [Bosea thiooxidans]SKB96698.1 hypothetical protein SAMN05660750_03304 [Bosea thiooxidans]